MTDTTPTNQQQLGEWVRQQFQRANKHLAENGVLFDSVKTEESRYLAPYVAVWKIVAQDKKPYWVISGDVPVDYTLGANAPSAREALRHFSLNWQLQAENIFSTGTQDKTQVDFANLLVHRANHLYTIFEDNTFWS